MATLTRLEADKFWDLCNWAHEVWSIRRELVDDNDRLAEIQSSNHATFVHTLSTVLHDYTLLQMAKLHDPAQMSGRANLSLDYVLDGVDWDIATRASLTDKRAELDSLYFKISGARHRIIAHNDRETLLGDLELGAFPLNADQRYFDSLLQFVRSVYVAITGNPCADFAPFARGDARQALSALLVATGDDVATRGT